MPKNEQIVGACPKCGGQSLGCKYNLFQSDDLRIDSWEHKCPDCGHRETTAVRSDDEDRDESVDPTLCPYCGRTSGV